jgi:NADPH-dependent curcumin reductase CurA
VLARRPVGLPQAEDWRLAQSPVPALRDGEVLVKVNYVSLDPAMRSWISEARSYLPPVEIGELMRGGVAGRVLESRDARFAPGDAVTGFVGVQEYAVAGGDLLDKVDTAVAPLPVHLAALGVPGMTAYFGLLDVAQLKSGDRVVVSGAGGAVGTLVGQIAKIHGCRVVGITGGAHKVRYLVDELGFDAAIDYKSEDVTHALRQHFRKGINVYFDNVGGDILDAALANLATGARIVLCGAISQYNNTGGMHGPKNYLSILVHRATLRGMLVFDYEARQNESWQAISKWIAEGKLKSPLDIVEGFENFPDALLRLFRGENLGKQLLRVAPE